MQITELQVDGLFGRFDHHISFPNVDEQEPGPSVTILYGINGVGKTTLLRFLEALLQDEFSTMYDVFRSVPFALCKIIISDLPPLSIRPDREDDRRVLRIEFAGETAAVAMDLGHRSQLEVAQRAVMEAGQRPVLEHHDEQTLHATEIWKNFQVARSELSFQFLQTARLEPIVDIDDADLYQRSSRRRAAIIERQANSLSERMRRFITEAQLDYRSYFVSSGADAFEKVIERLSASTLAPHDDRQLITRLVGVQKMDQAADRFGLEREDWDYDRLVGIIRDLDESGAGRERTLAVVAQYLEMLEARAERRGLVEERLSTFERVMNEFLVGKRVRLTAKEGLRIETEGEEPQVLSEHNLSSGERHLLYLMASGVMTRRKGTVIAIDEPEMSMHVAWQRRLIPALLECAARAEPQFIFATHSPELIANYQDRMVELRATPNDASA